MVVGLMGDGWVVGIGFVACGFRVVRGSLGTGFES